MEASQVARTLPNDLERVAAILRSRHCSQESPSSPKLEEVIGLSVCTLGGGRQATAAVLTCLEESRHFILTSAMSIKDCVSHRWEFAHTRGAAAGG